jgi:hypothetical protein
MSDNFGEPTLGEVYRLCQRIETKVDKTNGRVNEAEDRLEALEKDNVRIKAFWSAGAVSLAVFGNYLKNKMGLP